jgi:hypothetical protein
MLVSEDHLLKRLCPSPAEVCSLGDNRGSRMIGQQVCFSHSGSSLVYTQQKVKESSSSPSRGGGLFHLLNLISSLLSNPQISNCDLCMHATWAENVVCRTRLFHTYYSCAGTVIGACTHNHTTYLVCSNDGDQHTCFNPSYHPWEQWLEVFLHKGTAAPDCTPGTCNTVNFTVLKPSDWKQGHIVSIKIDEKGLDPGTLMHLKLITITHESSSYQVYHSFYEEMWIEFSISIKAKNLFHSLDNQHYLVLCLWGNQPGRPLAVGR